MNIQFLSSSMDSTTMSNISMIVMLVIMFAVMYFLLYRPQKKQQKKDAEMRNSLEIGDEVTTIGGIVGRVIALKEDTFVLETGSDRTKIRFRRSAISSVEKLDTGDAKKADTAKK